MLAILVANSKGGSGKTTIATHLAGAYADRGLVTALADADRQKSSWRWLRRRPDKAQGIVAMDWTSKHAAPPDRVERLVIDAAAGLRKAEVKALVALADIIVVPLLASAFDEEATRRFVRKLCELKKIQRGKKAVLLVGNRLRGRTAMPARLVALGAELGLPVVPGLPERAVYAALAGRGLSAFDSKAKRYLALQQDWQPLLRSIEGIG
jgi:chromosome partitioning protein